MKAVKSLACIACAVSLFGCTQDDNSIPATLYRNSSIASGMKIHFATFGASGESSAYNLQNCQMTARVLNANIKAQPLFKEPQAVGFWCEPGDFSDEGLPPMTFDAEFPTDAR